MDIVERLRLMSPDTIGAEAANEIERLRAVESMRDEELASVREKHGDALIEADRLRADAQEVAAARGFLRQQDRLLRELAAAQAREAQLRESVEKIADWQGAWGPWPETNEAWCAMAVVTAREAVPQNVEVPDDTALCERLAVLLDEMADEAPINGNELAQMRIRMKAAELRAMKDDDQ